MADANNAFLTYDETTGLKIKNKAEIMQDLTLFFQAAYGGDLIIQEGTEVYTFVDLLSTGISNIAASVKGVWDAFSFIGASGASLDILCNAFGISRYEGETDEQLRSRYYISIFSKSVGTMDGLRAQLMKLTDMHNSDSGGTLDNDVYSIIETAITEYLDEDSATSVIIDTRNHSSIVTATFPIHSITTVIKLFDKTQNQLLHNGFITSISISNMIESVIENYKSLGCICNGSSLTPGHTLFNNFYYALGQPTKIKIDLTWDNATDEVVYSAMLKKYIKQNIYNYINSLKISIPATLAGIQSCIYKASLDLTDKPLITINSISYDRDDGSGYIVLTDKIELGLVNYAYMDNQDWVSFTDDE